MRASSRASIAAPGAASGAAPGAAPGVDRRPGPGLGPGVALEREARGRIVAVGLAGQPRDRRERDPEAVLELGQPLVAQRQPDHGRDRRRVAQARRHPARVVVAPGDRHVRLLGDDLDDLVEPRAAVPEIAGDDQLADREVADHPRDRADQLALALVAQERIEQAVQELGLARQLIGEHQLAEHRVERIGDDPGHVLERVVARQVAHHHRRVDRDPVQQRAPALGTQPPGHRLPGLARVVDQREQLIDLLGREPPAEQPLEQRTHAARGVVQHLAELDVLPVDVADHVDGGLGQREDGLEVRELREHRGDVGVALREDPEMGQGHGVRSLAHTTPATGTAPRGVRSA
jgi:hypothetical protein